MTDKEQAALALIEARTVGFMGLGVLIVSAEYDYPVGVQNWRRPTACPLMATIGITYREFCKHGCKYDGDVMKEAARELDVDIESVRAINAGFEGWNKKRLNPIWNPELIAAGRDLCARYAVREEPK